MLLLWIAITTQLISCYGQQQTTACNFNNMCSCSSDQHNPNTSYIQSISCQSVPFYKFPNIPEGPISQLEITGSTISTLEEENLAHSRIQSLILTNNRLQHVANKSFSALWQSLSSLDLSYNKLNNVPFPALKELKNVRWINLHGNQISSINGDWSLTKNTITTLFLGENDIAEISSDTPEQLAKNIQGLHEFKALLSINLDGNRIQRIYKNSLPATLQSVSISHNLLEQFPLNIVETCSRLQWLNVRGNNIKSLPQHTFSRRMWIEKVDLGENSLENLPKSPFNNSVNIGDLNLAFNNIETIENDSFLGLNSTRITLSYNRVNAVDEKAFNGVEKSLEYLDIDHNNLESIPYALSQLKSLRHLHLSSNLISKIPDSFFSNFCHRLKGLNLNDNLLSNIPSKALKNCKRISHLNIGYNNIQDIGDADFIDFGENIKNLILSNNGLTVLKKYMFADIRDLQELSISFNMFKNIDPDAFAGAENLHTLEMSSALERKELDAYDIFRPLKNLEWLSLDNNNFHTVAESSFDSLRNIKFLNLESNKLQSIPNNLFKRNIHTKLSDLRLSHNHLNTVSEHTFESISNLEVLTLTGNYLESLPTNSFTDLSNLRKLLLNDNRIKSISSGAFSNLQNLVKLDLQNNDLTELTINIFLNLSTPLHLNLSNNQLTQCEAENTFVNIEVLDLRHNSFKRIPKCLDSVRSLKRLYFDFNIISGVDYNTFGDSSSLEYLSLSQNQIAILSSKAFSNLPNLQYLDLSKNALKSVHSTQFAEMPNLRILKLNHNNLNDLQKDVFENTKLEFLDLSYNTFNSIPSLSLTSVGSTLRKLSFKANKLDSIDSTTFSIIPNLLHLNLGSNRLAPLPDNVFSILKLLHHLDLSNNNLSANFKELFQHTRNLRQLNLAKTGIGSTPTLPLPNLIHLNLSDNNIETISTHTMQELNNLKVLDLSNNQIHEVPTNVWSYLSSLKTLDLSNNPIKEIIRNSFNGLNVLQDLNIQDLKDLNKFEAEALLEVKILSSLKIQTWPKVANFEKQFCNLLANLHQLRVLKINFVEDILKEQLHCLDNRKIHHLDITGKNLKSIDGSAFRKFTNNPDLVLKLTGTQIKELPAELFSKMYKISYLTLDLSNNLFTQLSPEIFYKNGKTWKNAGKTLVSGGISISGNPFKCGCQLARMGEWLRRWMRENLRVHNAPVEMAEGINELIKEATCTDVKTGTNIPIVHLSSEDLSCESETRSHATSLKMNSVMFFILTFYYLVCKFCK